MMRFSWPEIDNKAYAEEAAAGRSVCGWFGLSVVRVEVAVEEAILSSSKCHFGRMESMTQMQMQLSILQAFRSG
jgi:hypothetical protein